MTADLKNAINEANKLESPRAFKSFANFPQAINNLTDSLQDAREWALDEDLIALAEKLLVKLEATQELYRDMGSLQQESPIKNESSYVRYVHTLEKTIETAIAGGVDSSMVQMAKDLITQAQIEYWLSVRIERLKNVDRAAEANEHDMNCLRKTIQRGHVLHASEALVEQASSLLRRLDTELEICRALATIPEYRLPPPEPIEGYWQEDDMGRIKETEGFPYLPPDSTEYIWEHSRAYISLSACIDRLRNSLVNVDPNTNAAALAEVKEKLSRCEKDMKILEAKDVADRQVAFDAAAKALKKLKKKNKKAAPGSPPAKKK